MSNMYNLNHERLMSIPRNTEFKNRREFCDAIGADFELCGTSSKRWELFESYFVQCHGQLRYDGRKITLTDVYPVAEPYVDGRSLNSIYIEHFRLSLMNALKTSCKEMKAGCISLTLPRWKWYQVIGLINDNYYAYKDDEEHNEGYVDWALSDFYDSVNRKNYKVFNQATSSLLRRALLADYEETYLISGTVHEGGEDVSAAGVERYYNKYELPCSIAGVSQESHYANVFEKHLVAHVKRQLFKKFSITNHYELPYKKRLEFKKEMSDMYTKLGWIAVSPQIKLSWNQEDMIDELDSTGKKKLNERLVEFHQKSIQSRVDKLVAKENKELIEAMEKGFGNKEKNRERAADDARRNDEWAKMVKKQEMALVEERVKLPE